MDETLFYSVQRDHYLTKLLLNHKVDLHEQFHAAKHWYTDVVQLMKSIEGEYLIRTDIINDLIDKVEIENDHPTTKKILLKEQTRLLIKLLGSQVPSLNENWTITSLEYESKLLTRLVSILYRRKTLSNRY